MVDFVSELNDQTKRLYSYLTNVRKTLKSNKNNTIIANQIVRHDPSIKQPYQLKLKQNIQQFTSDKVTLLNIAKYCKLLGLYNKLLNDRIGNKVRVTNEVYKYVNPFKIFTYEVRQGRWIWDEVYTSEKIDKFLNIQLNDYDTFSHDIYTLVTQKHIGNINKPGSDIYYFHYAISKLHVKTKALTPNYKLQLKDVIDPSQFAYVR